VQPVNLDIPALEVDFLEEHDPCVNSLSVGEIALDGIAPAIAKQSFMRRQTGAPPANPIEDRL
jgi:CO/xanthine dehydrogenase Mo-binding subunit